MYLALDGSIGGDAAGEGPVAGSGSHTCAIRRRTLTEIHREQSFPFPCRQVFDLVADVERYPEFVPGYRWARILGWEGGRLRVRQEVGVAGMRWAFETDAAPDPPHTLVIRGRTGPFRELTIHWTFEPQADACRIRFHLVLRPLTPLPDRLGRGILERMAERTLAAFRQRAESLYGRSSSSR